MAGSLLAARLPGGHRPATIAGVAFFCEAVVLGALAITLLAALSRPAFRGFGASPAPAPGLQPPELAPVEAATRR